MNWLVDGLGVLGIVTTILVYQQKDQKRLLWWKLTTDSVWLLHYLTLGAYSACAASSVAILRSAVFLNQDKKWAQGKGWLVVFMAISILLNALVWQNMFSLLPLISSLACIVAYWIGNPRITRLVSIPAAGLYLVYAVAFHSIEGVVCEMFIIISAIVGYFRHDYKKRAVQA
ncbi:MAG: YgjV family protein [Clostridia bacterium]|nr:YgjV family protein [Clostridia bacterium]